MNICIVSGKIISKIDFKFIINSHNKSIAIFHMELSNTSIIKTVAYDEMADKVYSELKQGQYLIIEGKITNQKTQDAIEIMWLEVI